MMGHLLILVCTMLVLLPIPGLGSRELPGVLDDFPATIGEAHSGNNLFWHGAAVGSTVFFVASGADRDWQGWLQENGILGRGFENPVLFAGNFWTIGIALWLYLDGRAGDDPVTAGAGVTAFQAVVGTFLVVTTEKFLTGRRGPAGPNDTPDMPFVKTDDPADFAFDFWNSSFSDGRFFWPSGHTASAFSLVSALVSYYPDEDWLAWLGYPLAALMGYVMMEGDYHWLSDVVAGACIGHVIGWTAGRRARGRISGVTDTTLEIVPVIGRESAGLALRIGM